MTQATFKLRDTFGQVRATAADQKIIALFTEEIVVAISAVDGVVSSSGLASW